LREELKALSRGFQKKAVPQCGHSCTKAELPGALVGSEPSLFSAIIHDLAFQRDQILPHRLVCSANRRIAQNGGSPSRRSESAPATVSPEP
jgi:hypothetical protein